MDTLEVRNLSKTLGRRKVLDSVAFTVSEGEIAGFVGPNGAGKTTTIRLLTGLIRPDSGEINICGKSLSRSREAALAALSAIVETPGLYLDLTGMDHLRFLQRMRKVPEEKLKQITGEIGLGERLDDKVKKYSLGMKQRLALGLCLLTDPKLLILDEPTNGLDPDCTIELRELIVRSAKQCGCAVLFSSHLLSEVEKIASKIIFIRDGKIVSEQSAAPAETLYRLSVSDPQKAVKVLTESGIAASVVALEDGRVEAGFAENRFEKAMPLLLSAGVAVRDVEKEKDDLEAQYRKIFRGKTS